MIIRLVYRIDDTIRIIDTYRIIYSIKNIAETVIKTQYKHTYA